MIKKITNFFKRLFGKEEQLKIEAPKDNMINQNSNNNFRKNLINNANDRARLLDMQKAIKAGTLSEKDLSDDDITELKKLYCEQILDLSNSIEYYTKQIKSSTN